MAEGLLRGGEYEIVQADLVLSTGKVIGLKSSILNLTIFEDIEQLSLTGQVVIQDAMNLASTGPIIGQEYFRLKIRTPTAVGVENILDYTENAFMVTSLEMRERNSGGTQVSILSFCSREFVINQRATVRRTLVGSYSSIVEQMLRKDLDSKKKFFNEPSSESKKIISPNIRPFGVIDMAMRRAVSYQHSDPTYLFFENTRGYNFRTLGHLYTGQVKMKYTKSVAGTITDGKGATDVERNLHNIENYVISGAPDIIYNYRSGIYSSEMLVHDIISKSYQKYTYNYLMDFNNERHVDSATGRKTYPLANPLPLTADGKRIDSFPAKQYLQPTTSFANDTAFQDDYYNMPYTPHTPQESSQKRNSQLAMLETGLQVNIDVLGTTVLAAGDIVECNIPFTGTYTTTENDKYDRLYRGKFLVKALRHDFNGASREHKVSMNLCKDNLLEPIGAPSDNFEPQSNKSKGTTYEEWDNAGFDD